MSGSDITIDSVRLALGMQQMRAETAALNIARANVPGASATSLDFGASQSLLAHAAAQQGQLDPAFARSLSLAADAVPQAVEVHATDMPIQLDEQVADAASANLDYQALSEALSRHLGLMRLAIAGRS